jgi:hypothetical protein
MSVLKVAVASVLALSLVLGLALPALADSGEPLSWTEDFQARVVKGEVTYVDEANQEYFTVQSGEDEISIRVDENTSYFITGVPGLVTALAQRFRLRNQAEVGTPEEQGLKFRLQNQAEVNAQNEHCMGLGLGLQNRVRAGALVQNQARLRLQNQLAQTESAPVVEPQPAVPRPFGQAGFSDIEVGDGVLVWLANGDNLAKWVLIVEPAVRTHVGGTITELSSETITIAPDDGEAVTLRYNQDTVFVLNGFTLVEERQLARAVYDSEYMLAKKIMVYLPG